MPEQASGCLPNGAGLLIVDRKGKGENEFATLAEALNAALSGDVIELRFNGPHEEKPIKLANQRVTIRARRGISADGRLSSHRGRSVKCPRSMFTADGGRLTLINVALQLHVPREVPADNWSLAGNPRRSVVRLEKCTLSMRTPRINWGPITRTWPSSA